MEVHAHSHTERKKWTHYLWEFLMLFLAVFCGFLAENQREHMVEHQREKTYMSSFIEDLKLDTAQLNNLIELRRQRVRVLDTLFELLNSDQYIHKGHTLYRLYSMPYWDILSFYPNDRTMQQLKNAGGLRLIRNQKVSNEIMNYDVLVRNRKEYEPLQVDIANQINQDIENLLDPVTQYKINHLADSVAQLSTLVERDRVNVYIDIPEKMDIPPLQKDIKRKLLKNFYTTKTLFIAYMRANMQEKQLATEALELIKKEYHLK
jgi:hypothetical protein